MNVRVVLFPDGEDPDSYAKNHSSTELTDYISQNAQDFIRFKTAVLIKEVGNDPIKKAALVKEIVTSIAVIPDQIKRAVYTQECSSLLDIPEQALINETNKILRKNFSKNTKQETHIPDEAYNFPVEPPKQEQGNDVEHWEYEIIRLLITFGAKAIEAEVLGEDGTEQKQEVAVCVYILSNIANDGLTFTHPLMMEVYNMYNEYLNQEVAPEHHTFTNHENQKISKLAIDILTEKYEISKNWERHRIMVKTEEDQLKIAVINTVYAFKLCKVNQLIQENQDQIKTADNDDDRIILMKELLHYQEVKKKLADKLGRIILR